jgi:molecular chaperone GrpE
MPRDLFGRGRRGPFDNVPRDDRAEAIRVTDRRRIHVDDGDEERGSAEVDAPNLKPSYVEELEARVRAAEQKTLEVNSRFEQLRAQLQKETDETRQRLNKAADERARREKADFIVALLPVLDNLQRATEAADNGSSPEVIAEGIRQTAASFEKALAAAGVEPINAMAEQFDPELHDAVETAEASPEDEGKVIDQHAPGYRMGEKLLRPARVKVGRPAAKGKQAV